MATRFYLPASGTAPLDSLAIDTGWTRSDSLVRRPCSTIKSNTSLTYKNTTWATTSTASWGWIQFQSLQLGAEYSWTTGDTVSMVIKCAQSEARTDSHLAYCIRVVSADGSTIRGTIGVYRNTSTEYPDSFAGAATRIHSARTDGASNFSSQIGDRIIIEIGHYGVTPTATIVYHPYGDPTATADYALTADLTTNLCPWVELSRTVSFITPASDSTPAYLKGGNNSSGSKASYLTGTGFIPYAFKLLFRVPTVSGTDTTSTTPVYLCGEGTTSSSKHCFLDCGGGATSGTASAFMYGNSTAEITMGVFTAGGINATSQAEIFTQGSIATLDSQPAYIEGYVSEITSSISAFLQGVVRTNIFAYLTGQTNTIDSIDAYVCGGIATSQAAFMLTDGRTNSSKPAYLRSVVRWIVEIWTP